MTHTNTKKMSNQLITQALGQLAHEINQERISHRDNGDTHNYNLCIKKMIEIQFELESHTHNGARIMNDILFVS